MANRRKKGSRGGRPGSHRSAARWVLALGQYRRGGHVAHILTRLGFTSRSQIASWVGRGGYDLP
ncbi:MULTISPECIES: hypothetical protein [Streptomyces]|uniref:hypothetical protein n=1 Tax=Streptomyces herbicida TaxID=3065675 RepID=UPI00292D530A|nr:hypothetical protein [Streptomyces sp. NEAU-HV9]